MRAKMISAETSVGAQKLNRAWIAAMVVPGVLVFVPLALPPLVLVACATCALFAGVRVLIHTTHEALRR